MAEYDYETVTPLPLALQRVRQLSLVVTVVAAIIVLPGLLMRPDNFYSGYLFGFFFWLSLSLGSLGVLMLHTLTTGDWGMPIRRHLEAAASVLPVLAVLVIPIVLGRGHLFPWAMPDVVAHNDVLQKQAPYMHTGPFIFRLAIYFALWSLMAVRMARLSREYDRTGDQRTLGKLKATAGPGAVILAVTVSLVGVDLLMSRDAGWFSTMFGFILIGGAILGAIIFSIVMLWTLSDMPGIRDQATPEALNDLGNLFLAFTVFWFYVMFGQYIVIWMGNEKVDTFWFTNRGLGQVFNPWCFLAISLAICNFLIPFFLLLQRPLKRNIVTLGTVAAFALVLRVSDIYWLVKPSGVGASAEATLTFGALLRAMWLDLPMPFLIGGIWMFCYLGFLSSRPLVCRAMDDALYGPNAPAGHGGGHHGGTSVPSSF